jgi:hypothetical protein
MRATLVAEDVFIAEDLRLRRQRVERGRRGTGGARENGAGGSDYKRQATLLHQNDPLRMRVGDPRVGGVNRAPGARGRMG